MSREIFRLLLDYLRRTLGVWPFLVFVLLMQMSIIWVLGNKHVPVAGAVIAALAFCSTWNSPHLVMRTLPIKTRELALLRWWENIGLPMPFIVLALVLSWFANDGSRFPTPPFLSLWIPVSASFAALAILSVLPLPFVSSGRSNTPVALVYTALALGGIYGVPPGWLPAPLPAALLVGGLLLALISFGLARSGRVLQMPAPARLYERWRSRDGKPSGARTRLRGWPVLVAQWVGNVFLLAFASVVLISIVRPHAGVLRDVLPWLFVSVTGAAGSLLGRSWLRGVGALRCLPIRSDALALILCAVLAAPMAVAGVAATVVNAIVPEWGLAIPLYMVPVFAMAPVAGISMMRVQSNHPVPRAIQEWLPTMQLVGWPLWAGSFMSVLARWYPAWFAIAAAGATVLFATVAYFVVFTRIRSGAGLERLGDPLAPS